MALLTTFATTPLVSFLYPPWYQRKLDAWKRGEIDWDTGAPISGGNTSGSEGPDGAKPVTTRINRMLVYLRLDNMPATLTLVSLFGKQAAPGAGQPEATTQDLDEKTGTASVTAPSPTGDSLRTVRAHGLRLLPLGDRESNVMTVSQVDEYSNNDTVLNIFRTVGQFLRIAVSGEAAVMPEARFAEALLTKSSDISSDLVLVPWSESGNLGDTLEHAPDSAITASPYTQFASTILGSTDQNVGIFFPRGTSAPVGSDDAAPPRTPKMTRAYSFSDLHRDIPIIPVVNVSHHIFVPYLGGPDDDFALSLVLQLCEKDKVTATIYQIVGDSADARDLASIVSSQASAAAAPRITVETITAGKPVDAALGQALSQIRPNANGVTWQNLIIVGRHIDRAASRTGNEVKDCLGIMASKFIGARVKADLLVVQARARR